MCSVSAALIGLSAAQGITSMASAHQQAKAQSAYYNSQAEAAEQNARIADKQREQISEKYLQKQRQLDARRRLVIGQHAAEAGASGLTSSGSVQDMDAATLDEWRNSSMNLLGNQRNDTKSAYINQVNYINQANNARAAAYNARQQGKQAMQDTMGQAAALTGGYGSTYGQAVGQQQYNAYLQNLNDVVPELYQLALERYNMEGDDLKTQYSLLADQYQQEYGQYRDMLSDWQTDRSFLSGRYDSERNLDYGMWGDARDFAYQDYRNGIADQQWQQQYQENIRQFNEQMALSREQFAWQQAQAAAAAAAKSSGSGSGGSGGSSSGSSKGSGSQQSTEKYTASTAMRLAAASSSSTQGQILALDAMYENGNITKQEHTNLVYALKNPGR